MARFESAMNRVRKKHTHTRKIWKGWRGIQVVIWEDEKKTDVVVELSSATTLTKRESWLVRNICSEAITTDDDDQHRNCAKKKKSLAAIAVFNDFSCIIKFVPIRNVLRCKLSPLKMAAARFCTSEREREVYIEGEKGNKSLYFHYGQCVRGWCVCSAFLWRVVPVLLATASQVVVGNRTSTGTHAFCVAAGLSCFFFF